MERLLLALAIIASALLVPPTVAHVPDEPWATLESLPVLGDLVPHCPDAQNDAGTGGDAGDERASGTVLPGDGTHEGCGDRFDQRDWYALDVAPGDRIRVSLDETDCSRIKVSLHRDGHADANAPYASDDAACGVEATEAPGWDDVTRWHINVQTRSGGGHYALTVEHGDLLGACGEQDDAGSGGDTTHDHPLVFAASTTTTGCLDEFDSYDAFDVHADAGDVVTVTATSLTCAEMFLVAGGGDATGSDQDETWEHADPCEPLSVTVTMERDGRTPVDLHGWYGYSPYELDVTIT